MIVGVFGIYYKGDDFRKVGIGLWQLFRLYVFTRTPDEIGGEHNSSMKRSEPIDICSATAVASDKLNMVMVQRLNTSRYT